MTIKHSFQVGHWTLQSVRLGIGLPQFGTSNHGASSGRMAATDRGKDSYNSSGGSTGSGARIHSRLLVVRLGMSSPPADIGGSKGHIYIHQLSQKTKGVRLISMGQHAVDFQVGQHLYLDS